jgi:hypothetical protein
MQRLHLGTTHVYRPMCFIVDKRYLFPERYATQLISLAFAWVAHSTGVHGRFNLTHKYDDVVGFADFNVEREA